MAGTIHQTCRNSKYQDQCYGAVLTKRFIIIIGSTALGGPWPSLEALPIRLC